MATRFPFTMARIAALPEAPPGKRDRYWDDKVRGLVLRVTASGAKSFYFTQWHAGRAEETRLGAFPGLNVDDARKIAQEMIAGYARGENPANQRRDIKKEPTFGEVFHWWLDGFAKPRKKTWREDDRQFRSYLDRLTNRKAGSITRADVTRLHAEIGERHGIYQANRTLALLKTVLNRAITEGVLKGPNPAAGIDRFPEVSRDRRLMPGEIAAFLEAVDAEQNEDIRDYVLVSLFTGARKTNVLEMRWEDVDLVGALWRIPVTKNKLPQMVPLGAPEMEILDRRKAAASGPWVFPSWGKTGHMVEPKSGWRRILAQAGIIDLRLHDLRRSLGSWMADTGTPINVIGKTLNHLSPATTQVYARLSVDPIRQAKELAVKAMLGGRLGGTDASP